MKRPDINLHIEELVLHGFSQADGRGISAAVQEELARLLASSDASGMGAADRSIDTIDAGDIRVQAGARSESIGTQIAGMVFGGLPHE